MLKELNLDREFKDGHVTTFGILEDTRPMQRWPWMQLPGHVWKCCEFNPLQGRFSKMATKFNCMGQAVLIAPTDRLKDRTPLPKKNSRVSSK